jgi:hypothetical protein
MRKFIYILLIVPFLVLNAQKIGEFADEKPHISLPPNALGLDLMIGEGGFGLGGFYNHSYSNRLTGFIDFSISESKHDKEVERYNIYGYPLPIYGKKNRVFVIPFNAGMQYRLFYNSLTDNLRPYISAGVGPTIFVTTPAIEEFFKSFGDAKAHFGVGGYVGFGANFGLSANNLTGINIRYYINQLFNDGIEQYYGEYNKTLHQVSLTINVGFMY